MASAASWILLHGDSAASLLARERFLLPPHPLKPEVVQAVAEGKFHVWAVSHVDEGIELLTGLRAGTPDEPDTLHGRAAARLRQFSAALTGTREDRTTHIIEVPPSAAEPRPPTPPPPPIPPR